jgi:hypothetical protein
LRSAEDLAALAIAIAQSYFPPAAKRAVNADKAKRNIAPRHGQVVLLLAKRNLK